MILSTFSGLRGRIVLTMLFLVLSRSFRLVAAEVTQKFSPTVASTLRPFATSNEQSGEEPCSAPVVTYSKLKSMLSSRDIQLFDVRNPDEYQAGRISDAVNIPLGILEESLKLSPQQFQHRFEVRLPGKDDDNVVFYCRSGNRSFKALSVAHQLGFVRVRHYKGGYLEWEEREGK